MQVGWAVVISKPSSEELAAKSILEAGYRSYLPRYRKLLRGIRIDEGGRRIRTRQAGEIVMRPLFSRYLFAELHSEQQWRPIVEAKGVMDLIFRGDIPALLDGKIIETIREAEQSGEFDEAREIKPIRQDLRDALEQAKATGKVVEVRVPEYGLVAQLIGLDEQGKARVLMQMLGRAEVRATVQAENLKVVGI